MEDFRAKSVWIKESRDLEAQKNEPEEGERFRPVTVHDVAFGDWLAWSKSKEVQGDRMNELMERRGREASRVDKVYDGRGGFEIETKKIKGDVVIQKMKRHKSEYDQTGIEETNDKKDTIIDKQVWRGKG